MGHGGAREGAGRPTKYTDCEGNPLKTKQMRVPEILTEKDIQDATNRKLKANDN